MCKVRCLYDVDLAKQRKAKWMLKATTSTPAITVICITKAPSHRCRTHLTSQNVVKQSNGQETNQSNQIKSNTLDKINKLNQNTPNNLPITKSFNRSTKASQSITATVPINQGTNITLATQPRAAIQPAKRLCSTQGIILGCTQSCQATRKVAVSRTIYVALCPTARKTSGLTALGRSRKTVCHALTAHWHKLNKTDIKICRSTSVSEKLGTLRVSSFTERLLRFDWRLARLCRLVLYISGLWHRVLW